VCITGAIHQKARNNEAWLFQYMSTQPNLIDLFHNKKGQLPVFRRQAEANVLEHLSGYSIGCESKKQANDFVSFTERYADVDLLGADIPANRSEIIAPLRKQALTILQAKSIKALAKPCFEVKVERDAAVVGFTLTVTLGFFKPDKPV
jgi:hypothetical protein